MWGVAPPAFLFRLVLCLSDYLETLPLVVDARSGSEAGGLLDEYGLAGIFDVQLLFKKEML